MKTDPDMPQFLARMAMRPNGRRILRQLNEVLGGDLRSCVGHAWHQDVKRGSNMPHAARLEERADRPLTSRTPAETR